MDRYVFIKYVFKLKKYIKVKYYLDEGKNWGLDLIELERSYEENKSCYDIKAIVIINPGNPTGQVLSRENIEEIIKFAYKKNLFIFADEVIA